MRKKFFIFCDTLLFDTCRFADRGIPVKARFSDMAGVVEWLELNNCVMLLPDVFWKGEW
jgi:hypothetical protein